MAQARTISTQTLQPLRDGWRIHVTEPGAVTNPDALPTPTLTGTCPGTIVSALQEVRSSLLKHQSPDDFDIWYVCSFEADTRIATGVSRLVFEGLATIADVWLNGEPILHSENMFLRYEVDVTRTLQTRNTLCLRFAALNPFLEKRRTRPRWRTKLVDHTQLRWVRTTLFGRMPGWHAAAQTIHAVGPWRPISLVQDAIVTLRTADIRTRLEGNTGIVTADLQLHLHAGIATRAVLQVGEYFADLAIHRETDERISLRGILQIPDVVRWWPHTHGNPATYPVRVLLTVGSTPVEMDFGPTGFRSLTVDQTKGDFSVSVNETPIFLRGACWTTCDSARLIASPEVYASQVGLARDAGMNMLRCLGAGFYDSDIFYDRCAEQGIALWQDFAFALMDYPASDSAFCESVTEEARQLLHRLQLNPALFLLCGNTECESVAAMQGLTAEQSRNPLFTEILPQAAHEIRPDVAYVPSSQWGGALPFQVNTGVSHYYGVGGYLRRPEDIRRSDVRFASECLGFANIPEDETIHAFLAERETPGRHPSWKAGVPRDLSQGWDFDDVRDHYIATLFEEDPARHLYSDMERYLALGRAVNGELMTAAFSEWRREESSCRGALVWFFQDLWPGAGWGLVDSQGQPKSVYYYLKRILSPIAVFFTDEGMNGLYVHLVNETPEPLMATLRLALYRHGQERLQESRIPVEIPSRGALTHSVEELVGHFVDSAYAYRFGPANQDVTVAVLEGVRSGAKIAPAFHFPTGMRFPRTVGSGLRAVVRSLPSGCQELTIRSERFAQTVRVTIPGYRLEDNYFHLEPEQERTLCLTPTGPTLKIPTGYVESLNAFASTKITFDGTEQ